MRKRYSGITLVETMIVALVSVIVLLAVANLMADSQRGFNQIYNKTNSTLAQDDYVLRRLFASVIRQASSSDANVSIDGDGQWVEVQYYSSSGASELDRYARFYVLDDELVLERGVIDPRQTLSSETVCEDVTSASFVRNGKAILMIISLDDGQQQRTVNTSAVMQNP